MQPNTVSTSTSMDNNSSLQGKRRQNTTTQLKESALAMAEALKVGLLQVNTIIDTLDELPEAKAQECFVALGVGKHFRHIYDHFLAVKNGLSVGFIDYNLRNRGERLETDRAESVQRLNIVLQWCEQLPQSFEVFDQVIGVESEVDCMRESSLAFHSTLARELLYLINHTIHHVAYVKLLMSTVGVELPASIGLAPSTASFERKAKNKN